MTKPLQNELKEVVQNVLWSPDTIIGYKHIPNNNCDHYDNDPRDSDGDMCSYCMEPVKKQYYRIERSILDKLIEAAKQQGYEI